MMLKSGCVILIDTPQQYMRKTCTRIYALTPGTGGPNYMAVHIDN